MWINGHTLLQGNTKSMLKGFPEMQLYGLITKQLPGSGI
jgi:hypothetical protein